MAGIRSVNVGLGESRLSSTLKSSAHRSTLMTSTKYYLLNFRNLTIAICFVFLAFSAQAQTADIHRSWSTVGAVGTVDENDTGRVFFDRANIEATLTTAEHCRDRQRSWNSDDYDRNSSSGNPN